MFCIQVPISDMSCPVMKSWKLRCCIARKRVGAAGKRADTGGLTAVRSLFKIFFLHQLDALTFDKSPCRDLLAVVNAHPSLAQPKCPVGADFNPPLLLFPNVLAFAGPAAAGCAPVCEVL